MPIFPGQEWVDAAYVATYVINCAPTHVLDDHFAFQKLFHKVPDYSFSVCIWMLMFSHSSYSAT